MTVRGKLLLAQLPLAVALTVVGLVAVSSVTSLGRHSDVLLQENYRSVLAAQRMRDALERLQEAALLSAIENTATEGIEGTLALFERELAAAEGNITENNERATLDELRRRWDLFREQRARFVQLAHADHEMLTGQLQPAAAAVREQTQRLLDLNQDAMVRKGQLARREAARIGTLMIAAAFAALILGALTTSLVTRRLVQPLELLARTVTHLREGDFETRVNISGNDEVAQLADSINAMATRLSQYRRSSLGELLLTQEASQAAIDSLPDPVVVFDVSGNILNVNQAAETILQIRLEGSDGSPLNVVDAGVRACLDRVRLHVLSGKGAYVPRGFDDAVRVTAADNEYYFLPRATPVHSEEGAVAGATVILQDVTRLRRVDDLRNNLVSTVAHELRTPLTSLRMAIHLCLEQAAGPLSDKQADLLYAAREECERLQAIIDELLDLARIQSGRIELHRVAIPPDALIDAVVDAHRGLAEEHHVLVEREYPPVLRSVFADRERIHLVLSNLFTNAVRHTPPGGRIIMRASADDGIVRFEVADTGTGIPAEYLTTVFDRFVRIPGTPGGTGLGLSIAKEIVEAHDGQIGVSSPPGEGATFWFTLPSAEAKP